MQSANEVTQISALWLKRLKVKEAGSLGLDLWGWDWDRKECEEKERASLAASPGTSRQCSGHTRQTSEILVRGLWQTHYPRTLVMGFGFEAWCQNFQLLPHVFPHFSVTIMYFYLIFLGRVSHWACNSLIPPANWLMNSRNAHFSSLLEPRLEGHATTLEFLLEYWGSEFRSSHILSTVLSP